MWRRVWSTTTSSINGGREIMGGGSSSTMMNWVRFMSRKRAENLRRINPKVPFSEAFSIAQKLYSVIQSRGPQTIGTAWSNAQEAGISEINSKTHLKILLKWMRGKNLLNQVCQHVGSNNKKFLLCTPQDAESVQADEDAKLKLRPVKSGKSKKSAKARRLEKLRKKK